MKKHYLFRDEVTILQATKKWKATIKLSSWYRTDEHGHTTCTKWTTSDSVLNMLEYLLILFDILHKVVEKQFEMLHQCKE